MRHWAIAVGINQYQFFQPLSHAQDDAQALQTFLTRNAGFPPEQCVLLTDTSPPIASQSTHPTRENILQWLDRLAQRYVQPRDVVWFFFSGYGLCSQGRDYLVPIDGNPADLDATAISLESLYSRFKQIPVETILLLDISRSQGAISTEMVGTQTAQLAGMLAIPTILSCQPGQFAHETAALGHGFFTAALLDSLRQTPPLTLAQLDQQLRDRLPALNQQYWRPLQHPLMICPLEKRGLPILRPIISAMPSGNTPPPVPLLATQPLGAGQSIAGAGSPGSAVAIAPPLSPRRQTVPMPIFMSTNGASLNGAKQQSFMATPVAGMVGSGSTSPVTRPQHGSGNDAVQSSSYPRPAMTAEPPPNGYSASPTNHPLSQSPPIPPVDAPVSVPIEDEADESWRRSLFWGGVTATALLLTAGVYWRNFAPLSRSSLSIAQTPTTKTPENIPETAPAIAGSTKPTGANQANTARSPVTTGSPITSVTDQSAIAQPATPGTGQVSLDTTVNDTPSPQGVKRPVLSAPADQSPVNPGVAPRQAPPSNAKRVSPGATTTSSGAAPAPNVTAPKKPVRVVSRTRVVIKSNQASPYWYGIQTARLVKPTDPQYQQAQQDIAQWSRDIWAIAQLRANQKRFDTAIMAAALVSADQAIHADAQKAIDRWCPSLSRQRVVSPSQRRQAKAICQRM